MSTLVMIFLVYLSTRKTDVSQGTHVPVPRISREVDDRFGLVLIFVDSFLRELSSLIPSIIQEIFCSIPKDHKSVSSLFLVSLSATRRHFWFLLTGSLFLRTVFL
jgi:hypothetical protein